MFQMLLWILTLFPHICHFKSVFGLFLKTLSSGLRFTSHRHQLGMMWKYYWQLQKVQILLLWRKWAKGCLKIWRSIGTLAFSFLPICLVYVMVVLVNRRRLCEESFDELQLLLILFKWPPTDETVFRGLYLTSFLALVCDLLPALFMQTLSCSHENAPFS